MAENQLSQDFVKLTADFKKFLLEIKEKFDDFDKIPPDEKKQIDLLNKNQSEIFQKLDFYFKKIDKIITNLDNNLRKTLQDFFRAEIIPILGKPEINNYIFTRPLGYAGDYVMMNFIYDYNEKFYGKTSFDKLINFYTCNLPVSKSNLKRKEYINVIIKKTFEIKDNKIASIGCGPAREMIELFDEGIKNQTATITLLDFEQKAFDFIIEQLDKIKEKIPSNFNLNFLKEHIINIFLKKEIREKLSGQNLIYCLGVFDYLSSQIAKRLLKTLFNLLTPGGKLIICNISLERSSHKSYYEFLGGWEMFHRTKEELINWAEAARIPLHFCKIINQPNDVYNYLIIEKK